MNDPAELNELFSEFLRTVNATAGEQFPNSLDERTKCNECLQALTHLPYTLPDDFTDNNEDAELGAILVQLIGEAMHKLRSEYWSVANARDVKQVYTALCGCLRATFTLSGADVQWGAMRQAELYLKDLHPKGAYRV